MGHPECCWRVRSGFGGAGFACGVALLAEFFHDGLDEGFGAFHAAEDGLEVEGGFAGVAGGGAVDAMLADEDERVGKQVEGDGEAAALGAHHELVLFELGAFLVKDVHGFQRIGCGGRGAGWNFRVGRGLRLAS